MGRAKMRIMDVARETGLNRSTIAGLYREDAIRVELETVDRLCKLFNCTVGDLFEYVADAPATAAGRRTRKSGGG